MQPPRLQNGIIERTRLLARLGQARGAACVVIQGPAGSGKTTLARQWRAQLIPFGHDCAWCMASAQDDAGSLLESLFSSLDQIDPSIAREAALIYDGDGEVRSADRVAIPLLNGLQRRQRPLVIFIDDYHYVTDLGVHGLVQTLLDFAPADLHIFLVSRTAPPLSLSRLRDSGSLVELDFADLRFTFSEAESLLQVKYPTIARRDARLLYDQTGGWGAGLRLASIAFQNAPRFAGQRARLQNAGDFVSYFNHEVLAQMPQTELDGLSRLSVAQRFNDGLAAALLGADEGLVLMNRLRRDNLFLLPMESGLREAWWRLHPLFRDVMRERFTQLSTSVQAETHALLGQWFGRRKLLVDAVRHCVAAEAYEAAADLVEGMAESMFLAGEMRPLVRAVAMLPPDLLESRVSLRLWVAWAELCYRRLPQCRTSIDRLAANGKFDDQDAQHQLTLLEGSLAIQAEDTDAGKRLVPALERLPDARDAILAGGRRNILGWLHIHLGNFDQARKLLNQPPLLQEDGMPLIDSAFGFLQSRTMLGYSYLREGDMRQSEQILRDVLDVADRALGVFSEPACNAASFLAAVLYEVNALDSLRTILEPRFDVIERVALPEALNCAAMSRIRLSVLEKNFQEALSELDRLDDQISQRGLFRAQGYVLAERVRILAVSGDLDAAAQSVMQLKALASRLSEFSTSAVREVRGLALSTEAHWMASRGDSTHALMALDELTSSDAYTGQARKQVQLEASVIMLLDRIGRLDEANRRIESLLLAARKGGLVRAVLDMGSRILDIGEAANQAGLLTPGASFYLEHLKLQHGSSVGLVSAGVTSASHQVLSEREMGILRALALTMSNKRVAQALDISPETVKWHLKNIYGKLGVFGRDDAVARARLMGML
jgi:LuxR family maltose regulon positive regulatory protein